MSDHIETQLEETVPITETVVLEADAGTPVREDVGHKRLISNYQSLLEAQEIYYPLAYRFIRELGRGRQGVVYQALRQGARGCTTQHAIKIHDPSIYPDTEKYWTDMGRIASQISKLQKVSSPQLVSRDIYEEVDGIGYTQMEVVEGIDVAHLIHGDHIEHTRPRSTAEEWGRFSRRIFEQREDRMRIRAGVSFYILRQILRGLEELHNAGFLHSDIKPANIMIDRLGIVKLIDYGRAVRIDEKNRFLLGTPLFMAPELHQRQPASVQSDLYSVGLVGLELLRGRKLLDTTNMSEDDILQYKLTLHERIPELLPGSHGKNESIVYLLRTLLHPDPAQRYTNAAHAESGSQGMVQVHKQLVLEGKDAEYDRELERYIEKIVGTRKRETFASEELIG